MSMVKVDIEYCKNCEEIYAVSPLVWLLFEEYGAESFHTSEDAFNCNRCGRYIKRYEGYMDSLRRSNDDLFVEDILRGITDLSETSKENLGILLKNFSVPSFTARTNGSNDDLFRELVKKRYVTWQNNGKGSFVTLNAYKLRLFDNTDILKSSSHQSGFIDNPQYVKQYDEATRRRKKRVESLINDLTSEQTSLISDRFDGKCALTGKDVPLHMDHVIPVSIGHGGTTLSNILPIWQRVNSSKSNRNIFEWYKETGARFDVCPTMFDEAIEYLADLNGMSAVEYREYVYECHANPIDYLMEEII